MRATGQGVQGAGRRREPTGAPRWREGEAPRAICHTLLARTPPMGEDSRARLTVPAGDYAVGERRL